MLVNTDACGLSFAPKSCTLVAIAVGGTWRAADTSENHSLDPLCPDGFAHATRSVGPGEEEKCAGRCSTHQVSNEQALILRAALAKAAELHAIVAH